MGPGPYGPPDFRKSPPMLKLAMEKRGRREKRAGEIREETAKKKTGRRFAPNWGKYVSALDQKSLEKNRGVCSANLSRITRGSDKKEYCR